MGKGWLAALCLVTGLAGAAERHETVPARFIGHWAGSPAACRDPAADDARLYIGADRVRFWESEGPVVAAVTGDPEELLVVAELSGEGQTWLTTAHFRLSADGRWLEDVESLPQLPFRRYRCAEPAAR